MVVELLVRVCVSDVGSCFFFGFVCVMKVVKKLLLVVYWLICSVILVIWWCVGVMFLVILVWSVLMYFWRVLGMVVRCVVIMF